MAAIVRAAAMKGMHENGREGVRGAPAKETKQEKMAKEKEAAKAANTAYLAKRAQKEDYVGWQRSYVEFGDKCFAVVDSESFESFILSVIGAACLMIGVQTYDGMDSKDNFAIRTIDYLILGIFGAECILKLLAESVRPWLAYSPANPLWKWNIFDLLVVIMCLPVLPLGNSAAALRLLRLLRLAKLVEKIPKLRALIAGLVGGMTEIAYISVLILLIFFLYAILGIEMFRDNDPWHFRNFFFTMVTLFRMATLEDWSDIFYINYFGCESYTNGGLYLANQTTCNSADCAGLGVGFRSVVENPTAPEHAQFIVNASMPATADNVYARCCFDDERFCKPDQAANAGLVAFYFVSYITVSALVMLSMFVGAISISMSESVKAINQERVEMEKAKRELKAKKIEKSRRESLTNTSSMQLAMAKENLKLPLSELNKRRRVGAILKTAWDGQHHPFDEIKERTLVRQHFAQLSGVCVKITHSSAFQNVIIAIIMLTGMFVGLSTSRILMRDSAYVSVVDGWNNFITIVFTVEAALKIFAEGFMPWRYLYIPGKGFVGWNVFDFSIVVGTWLPGSGSLVMILRLLRLLLVLKLVKNFPQLRLAVEALIGGIAAMGYIGLMLFVVFYFFGIFGGILFAENDPWHFKNLHTSLITLFRMSTMEDWTDVMYINYFGCDVYGYSEADGMSCTNPSALYYGSVLYSVAFIVIGSLVMLNLFIGVITTSMESTMADMEEEEAMNRKVQMMIDRYSISRKTVKLYREVFTILDLDGGGDLSIIELRIGLNAAGLFPRDRELQSMMDVVDPDGSGVVDFAEFVQFLAEVNGHQSDNGTAAAERRSRESRESRDPAVLAKKLAESEAVVTRQSDTVQRLRKELQQANATISRLRSGGAEEGELSNDPGGPARPRNSKADWSAMPQGGAGGMRSSSPPPGAGVSATDAIVAAANIGGDEPASSPHEGAPSVSLRQLSQREVWDRFVQNNGSKVLV